MKRKKQEGSWTGQWQQYGVKSATTPGKDEGRVLILALYGDTKQR
jgi:hypothetical protein